MSDELLQVRDLHKSFGALKVTDGVNLTVKRGEIHALIGPNGAGKTTLIHQLSGNLKSDRGSVIFDGRDISGLPMPNRVHLGLARSFQITSVLEGFSVLENVALAVQARSGSSFRFFQAANKEVQINEQAMTALARVRLDDRAHRRAGALSHGEKRQLEIAIALATEAQMLLLDEPLAGTSHEESVVLVELMRALRQTHTLVLIEHDMDAVFSLADQVSVLVYGCVIASGTPAAVRSDPDVRAAYLGEEEAA
ncbi:MULTISPECIES: ABC transporter ATP-binding protein [Brucella/Ochrobactrum group]|uniref:ABC transporter related n=1 Tax=Brucella anthropi (strain ATCC 49188 / DSM 6882 / CCUG 24695 / JCM 21032 / LMG 3331 / NBRC 15819 / NCTC 12168 / Alc 37) TaxID=439375 RepID=A6X652_BRUA4|nr:MULTISPECIES: ABC transporter ATP-binding protein [Brucella/Ochrobactrum group]ABS16706.1 ABC transporter related [Brucella anthropi ATCC 49188]AIK41576.1 ABC transporter family protein [Brucella anthropi]KAB2741526.1 ABC transporter ATP-binding protein [Brucella anthropi]KAB2754070.1 ABC transporter ATP-binding protein [Brucella anthropi]KAB2764688.1 ABC transporter ATP-binding protein [Brucella anthropi]